MTEGLGENLSRQIRDWIEAAGREAGKVARVSRRKAELLQLDWELLRRRADLGSRSLHLISQGDLPGWSKDPALVDLVDAVRALERKQQAYKAEVQSILDGGGEDREGSGAP